MLSEEEGGEVVRTIHHQSRTLAPPTNTHVSLEPSKVASFPQRSSVLSSPLLDNRHLTGPPRTIFLGVLLNYRLILSCPFFRGKERGVRLYFRYFLFGSGKSNMEKDAHHSLRALHERNEVDFMDARSGSEDLSSVRIESVILYSVFCPLKSSYFAFSPFIFAYLFHCRLVDWLIEHSIVQGSIGWLIDGWIDMAIGIYFCVCLKIWFYNFLWLNWISFQYYLRILKVFIFHRREEIIRWTMLEKRLARSSSTAVRTSDLTVSPCSSSTVPRKLDLSSTFSWSVRLAFRLSGNQANAEIW